MAYTLRFEDHFGGEGSDVVITSHTPDTTGVSWTKAGNKAGDCTVNGSGSTGPATIDHPFASGGSGYNSYTADISGTWESDQEAEATGWGNGQTIYLGIACRLQGGTKADGYRACHDGGGNQWRIQRVDGGTATNIAGITETTPQNTDIILLRCEGTASQEMFENGTSRLTATDSTYTGGSPGVITSKSYDAQGLDDFKARDQAAAGGRIMSSLVGSGGLAGSGGIAGEGGGLAG